MKSQFQLSLPWKFLGLLVCLFISYSIQAQGIKGKVVDVSGDPLPFTSIGVMGTSHGAASNVEGEYILALAPGKHKVRFQYLGYSPIDTTFTIGSSYISFNAVMLPEVVALPEAIVSGNGEDPAYTIMRRAIAKATYHSLQVDEYNAMVYIKGSGRLLKTPWLLRKKINKALAEEGIDSTVAFTQESVSKLHYIRPDQYRDTVISIRTSGDDNNTSPTNFIYSSFYEPTVVNGISPLAPDAFGHYRFEYLGFIQDGSHVINKIKVTPRAKGDSVFEGFIYIVDNVWSIHSLDLATYIWGIRFDIQQQFEPIMPDVWLPVHEIYDVGGSVFGFAFEYQYFAKLNDYKIKLNPDLEVPVTVLDVKVETADAKAAEAKLKNRSFDEGLLGLENGEELSAKQLRKMMREYKQQEIETLPEADTVNLPDLSTQVIDSVAYRRDSSYWQSMRPLPLTAYEVKGYQRLDSIAANPAPPEDETEEGQDSITVMMGEDGFSANVKRRTDFKLTHLITGGRYNLSDKTYLQLKAPLQSINFNTVDGFHFGYELEFGNNGKKPLNWEAGAVGRYAFSREAFNYDGKLKLFGKGWSVLMQGGNQTRQYGYDHPIYAWANSTYTLFVNRNYMKIYEQQFGRITYKQNISKAVGFDVTGEYADRNRLMNTTDLVFFDDKSLLYTDNDPDHLAGNDEVFNDHKAIITEGVVWLKPFWRYKVERGTKRKDYSDSPMLTLMYRKGWGEAYDPFDLATAQFDAKVAIGAGSQLSMRIAAGMFLGDDKPKYFHDFAHFPGNRMIGSPTNPVSTFRMLDYYLYSTDEQYAYGLFNYQFRRFGLTQFDYFRRQGIRENVIFNTLISPESNQYAEIGYGINYILRVLRVEFVTSWQNYTYQNFAVRIGVATDFGSIFGGF
ncbi:MAG: DUF5686 family protein [Saprospiraceae bacterium]|mgnify:FL=1|nr:DUF5686 family protein [Saprospiraceae bacterium]